jgi:hypothetical protein
VKEKGFNDLVTQICERFSEDEFKKSQLHPLFVYTAGKVYARGQNKHFVKWDKNSTISVELEKAFIKSVSSFNSNIRRKYALCFNIWFGSPAKLYKNTIVTTIQVNIFSFSCSLKGMIV